MDYERERETENEFTSMQSTELERCAMRGTIDGRGGKCSCECELGKGSSESKSSGTGEKGEDEEEVDSPRRGERERESALSQNRAQLM